MVFYIAMFQAVLLNIITERFPYTHQFEKVFLFLIKFFSLSCVSFPSHNLNQ